MLSTKESERPRDRSTTSRHTVENDSVDPCLRREDLRARRLYFLFDSNFCVGR
ncbi:Hypothetical protein A7982_04336 [Minicystis rosea]|nr:Hypothetical protein A7982_04336 [Minicystis rosea]